MEESNETGQNGKTESTYKKKQINK